MGADYCSRGEREGRICKNPVIRGADQKRGARGERVKRGGKGGIEGRGEEKGEERKVGKNLTLLGEESKLP